MKLCKDCKHNRRDWMFGQEFAKCGAIVNYGSGKPRWYCSAEREPAYDSVNLCGSEGKLFEQKTTFIGWLRSFANKPKTQTKGKS